MHNHYFIAHLLDEDYTQVIESDFRPLVGECIELNHDIYRCINSELKINNRETELHIYLKTENIKLYYIKCKCVINRDNPITYYKQAIVKAKNEEHAKQILHDHAINHAINIEEIILIEELREPNNIFIIN